VLHRRFIGTLLGIWSHAPQDTSMHLVE